MVTLNKTINIQGVSTIGDVQIAFMSANVPIDGKITISRNIQNKDAFEKNKDEVMKDFLAFDDYVYSIELEDNIKQKDGGADAESTQ